MDLLPVDEDLSFVGRVQPVEDVHQGRLAGAVLAQQPQYLARLDGQVDSIVGDDPREPFGDAPKFESQRMPPDMALGA